MSQGSREPAFDGRLIAWVVALAGFGAALFSPALLHDGDTYWHIEAGRWMIDNWTILRIDPFSYPLAGHPWQTHEWLGEVLLALAFVGVGWSGVLLMTAAAFGLTVWLLGRLLARTLGGVTLIVTLVLAASCIAGSLLARPHILALPLLTVWTAELIAARAANRRPSFWLLPVMVLWANLHASFLLGLGLIAPFALEAVLENRSAEAAKQWGKFALGALIAAILTPFGFDTLSFPFTLMQTAQLYTIVEWQPSPLSGLQPLTLAVGTSLFVLLWRGAKIAPLRLVVLLGLLYMALLHARHQMVLGIAGSLLLAAPLAQTLANRPVKLHLRRRNLAFFAVLVLALAGARLLVPFERSDGPVTPKTALAHLPEALTHAPVFNDYAFGGYLIFEGVHPFVDGRVELYGEDFLAAYDVAMRDRSALMQLLAKYRMRWSILTADNPAASAMDTIPGWRRLYADSFAVVHVKESE